MIYDIAAINTVIHSLNTLILLLQQLTILTIFFVFSKMAYQAIIHGKVVVNWCKERKNRRRYPKVIRRRYPKVMGS